MYIYKMRLKDVFLNAFFKNTHKLCASIKCSKRRVKDA